MSANDVTIRQMLEAGVHFGHQVRYWNPKMAPYIFGSKSKIHIIDLEKTLPLYKDAVNFLSSIAAKKGKILFVGTKQQARGLIRSEAERCRMPYVDYRWLGGMLTNYKTIRQSLKRLEELDELQKSPTFARIAKKEALSITREISKLEKSLGGIRAMGGLPDAIFVIDVGHEKIAVTEASKLKIPLVGVVDTNNCPDGIDYVIPGNDDSLRAIKLYLQVIVDAIIDARGVITEEEILAEKEDRDRKNGGNRKALMPKKKVFTRPSNTSSERAKAPVTDSSNVVADKADKQTAVVETKPKVKVVPKVTVTKVKKAEPAKPTQVEKSTVAEVAEKSPE